MTARLVARHLDGDPGMLLDGTSRTSSRCEPAFWGQSRGTKLGSSLVLGLLQGRVVSG